MLKVAGYNNNCLCTKENIKQINGSQIVRPPGNSNLDLSKLLSYSVYCYHAVWVTKDGHAYAIGDNTDKQIWGDFPAKLYDNPIEIKILNKNGHPFIPLSAVCGRLYTLYLIQSAETPLVYVNTKKKGEPIFLNINGLKPIKLFGGMTNSAVVTEDGSIIFINDSVLEKENNEPKVFKLPDNEIPLDISCCDDHIVVISKSGKAYQLNLLRKKNLKFKIIKEIKKHNFVSVGGCQNSNFAITQSGHVYGRGENPNGKLGLKKDSWGSDRYVEIKELKPYKIVKAYSGNFHSLFLTDDGKVIGCGRNRYGELLIDDDSDTESYYTPTKTCIKSGAKFAIVGDGLSVVFVNCEPPENQPNTFVDYDKKLNLDYVEEEEEIEEEQTKTNSEEPIKESSEEQSKTNSEEPIKESSEELTKEEKSEEQTKEEKSEKTAKESSEELAKEESSEEQAKEEKSEEKAKEEKSEEQTKEEKSEEKAKEEKSEEQAKEEKSEEKAKEEKSEEQAKEEKSEEKAKEEKSEKLAKESSEEQSKEGSEKNDKNIELNEMSEHSIQVVTDSTTDSSDRTINDSTEKSFLVSSEDLMRKRTLQEIPKQESVDDKNDLDENSINKTSENTGESATEKQFNESSEKLSEDNSEGSTKKNSQKLTKETPKESAKESSEKIDRNAQLNEISETSIKEVTEDSINESSEQTITKSSEKSSKSIENSEDLTRKKALSEIPKQNPVDDEKETDKSTLKQSKKKSEELPNQNNSENSSKEDESSSKISKENSKEKSDSESSKQNKDKSKTIQETKTEENKDTEKKQKNKKEDTKQPIMKSVEVKSKDEEQATDHPKGKKKNPAVFALPKEKNKTTKNLPFRTVKEIDPYPSFNLGLIIIIIFIILMLFLRFRK